MTYLLPASLCPSLQVPGPPFFSGAYASPGAALHCLSSFQIGAGGGSVSSNLNQNSARVEILARFGGGGYGLVSGLDYASSIGLNLMVNPGIAMMDGPIEQAVAASIALPDNQPTIWLWITSSGALSYSLTLAKPVAGVAVPLFRISSLAGSLSAADGSGVGRLVNGQLWRQTGDMGAPSDTPDPSLKVWSKTAAGLYLWDGVQHRYCPGQLVRTVAVSGPLTSSDETVLANAMAGSVSLTLPPTSTYSGRALVVVRTDSSANSLTVVASGTDVVFGGPVTLTSSSSVRLLAYGGSWYRV